MSPVTSSIKNTILNNAYNALQNMTLICLLHLQLPTGYLRLCHSKCHTSWKSLVVKHLFLCFIHRTCNTLYTFDFMSYFFEILYFRQEYSQISPLTINLSVFSSKNQSISWCAYNSMFSIFIAMIIFSALYMFPLIVYLFFSLKHIFMKIKQCV